MSTEPFKDYPYVSEGTLNGDKPETVTAPKEPSEAMLNAARDWSIAEYGKAIGDDAARGCWVAMMSAIQ